MIVSERIKFFLVLSVILIYPSIWFWQGLDFVDYGYWLTAYQQFFMSPMSYFMPTWGTVFIGHYWANLLNVDSLIVYKIGFALVNILMALISYLTLKPVFPKNKIVLFFMVLVAYLFIYKKHGIISYNNLSALFYLLGGSLIFWSLNTKNISLIFIAGAVLSFNLFIRIPNVLGILLISAIWLLGFLEKWPFKKISIFSAIFLCGYVFTIIIIFYLLQQLGQLQLYIGGVSDLFISASDSEHHHSFVSLLLILLRDYSLSLFSAGFCILASVFVAKKLNHFSASWQWISLIAIAVAIIPILNFNHIGDWLFPGFIYIVLGISFFFNFKSDIRQINLIYITVAILALVPLGSDGGMWNAHNGMWLALPMMLMTVYGLKGISWKSYHVSAQEKTLIFRGLIVVILIYSIVAAFTAAYHDNSNRLIMTHEVNHPSLTNVYTTKDRAKVVQELLYEISLYVKPGDYLLAYNKIPMVHYLTQTKPWLDNPWPLNYPIDRLKFLINERILEDKKLPLVVRAKGDTSDKNWPANSDEPIIDNVTAPFESRKYMAKFCTEYGYEVIWGNKFFEILSSDIEIQQKTKSTIEGASIH